MKKNIVYVVVLSMLFLISCKSIDSNAETNTTEKPNKTIQINKTKETELYTELDKQFNLHDQANVLIRRLTPKKYLIGMADSCDYATASYVMDYFIFDVESQEKKAIKLPTQSIERIWYVEEDGLLDFYLKYEEQGGFIGFPQTARVNINTGKVESTNKYVKLGSDYQPYDLGDDAGKTVLEDVVAQEDSIIFKTSVTPKIKVISKEANHIVVEIENFNYNEKLLKKIIDNKNYLNYKCSDYVDLMGIKHTAIDIELNGKKEYTCDFKTAKNESRNLIISFK
ncbi:hypothetical protein PV797_01565 [Clostridiaceae bacterium M8S5]|nr:hypothetical protein PV797_01565 [Clostridiaceae bacterium M8S5]